jgi:hypothetical protein
VIKAIVALDSTVDDRDCDPAAQCSKAHLDREMGLKPISMAGSLLCHRPVVVVLGCRS